MLVDDSRGDERIADLDGVLFTAMRTPDANADGAQARHRKLIRIDARRNGPVAHRAAKRQGTELRLGPLLRLICDHGVAFFGFT